MSGAGDALKDVANVMTLGVFGEALGQGMEKPDAPVKEEPKVAPVTDDEESRRESMRKRMRQGSRGRTSTILSQGSNLG